MMNFSSLKYEAVTAQGMISNINKVKKKTKKKLKNTKTNKHILAENQLYLFFKSGKHSLQWLSITATGITPSVFLLAAMQNTLNSPINNK